MFLRVIFLLGMMTFSAYQFFGYTLHITLQAFFDLSTEQVEAVYRGIRSTGFVQFGFLVVGFLYRRAIMLAVKKFGTALVLMLLPTVWRRSLAQLLAFPREYTESVWGQMNHWYDRRFGIALANWFRAIKYSIVLFLVVGSSLEFLLALVRGVLALPPVILQYKAEIVSATVAFVLGSSAQWFLLFLSRVFLLFVPHRTRRRVRVRRHRLVRRVIHIRYRFIVRNKRKRDARNSENDERHP